LLGTVQERQTEHKIMVPFDEPGPVELLSIQEGSFTVQDTIAKIRGARGGERSLTLVQQWPVRNPLTANMLRQRLIEREYPSELLTTTQRMIDTFLPVAKGGTACIPGPFGAGKTVLYWCCAASVLAKYWRRFWISPKWRTREPAAN
jgi:V/A-type H+-transporting ATPase subunit A